ncbi:eukaryotic translation initiation factor 4 gamma-like [Lathyrus oleraceus]|uniref:eukaryotic translation initiation factor 4 gamma-like n=1 Tax=Pisum sativum TaxID=3888 RepID=UPI0021D2DC93|nr:eukaryotic translation initiation factor 4 gamma-like [Pisum sativum]
MHYLQDLANQGVDISNFSVDWLPEHPPNFMKRMRESSERKMKKKAQKLGETSVSRPHVPLVSSSPSKFLPSDSPSIHLRQLSSSLPLPSPIYTPYEPTPSTTKPSETPISNPPSPPLQKFNLTTISLPISEAQMFNEPISPPSSTPSSPPYYTIASYSEPSDPQSPTLAQLQACSLSAYNQPESETNIPSQSEQPSLPPSEPHIETPIENPITHHSKPPIETIPSSPAPTSPVSEPEPTFPTLEEAIDLFVESSMEKIKSLSENSVRNDFIREAGERLQARLAREAEEKARREGEEKAHIEEEKRAREAIEKATAEGSFWFRSSRTEYSVRATEGAADSESQTGPTGLCQLQHSKPADSVALEDATASEHLGT